LDFRGVGQNPRVSRRPGAATGVMPPQRYAMQ
jgi:hypothetical protein